MMGVLVVARIAGTCAIVWMLIEATSISEGWKVFLIAAALVLGFAFNIHRNSRRKPPNSFGWRNAALIHTRKRPCARDAHFATLC